MQSNATKALRKCNQPVVIPNNDGFRTTPSIVACTKKGELLVGNLAKRQAVVNYDNTFYSVKRFIGTNPKELNQDLKQVAYTLIESDDKFKIKCSNLDKFFTPEEISAQILRKLVLDATKFLNQETKKAVGILGRGILALPHAILPRRSAKPAAGEGVRERVGAWGSIGEMGNRVAMTIAMVMMTMIMMMETRVTRRVMTALFWTTARL